MQYMASVLHSHLPSNAHGDVARTPTPRVFCSFAAWNVQTLIKPFSPREGKRLA